MSNKTELQSNNNDLQGILNIINGLPAANTNELPTLSQPATVDKVLSGYDYIDGDGNQKVGTMTNKAAATYGAKTSDQTISAGQYLSGAQTIKKVEQSGLSAENIVKDKTVTISSNGSNLWNITGTGVVIPNNITAYYGTSYPSSPTTGDIFYNPHTEIFYIFSNNNWTILTKEMLTNTLFPNGLGWEKIVSGTRMYVSNVSSTNIVLQSEWYNNSESAFVISSNAIDLTNYSTLSITFSIGGLGSYSDCYNYWRIGINTTRSSSSTTYSQRQISGVNSGNITYTLTMDVSGYSGNYYIYFGGLDTHSNAKCTVSDITLI